MKKILVLVLVLFALTAQATVTVTTSTAGPFTCNAVTVAFPFSFKIIAATDLVVVKRNVSSGVLTTLTNVTDYTVAGMGGSSGTVTLTSGSKCDAAYTLTITRTTPLTQTTSFTTQGAYLPKTHETALDKLTLGLQDYARLASALVGPQGPQGEVGAPGTVTAASGLILQSNGFNITLTGPPTLAVDYALELPGALPTSTSLLQLSSAGVVTATNTITGDLSLAGGASQSVLKGGTGGLDIGTSIASDLRFMTSGAEQWKVRASDGALVSAGGQITGLGAPVDSTSAATKGFVETLASGSITMGTGWSDDGCVVKKAANGLITIRYLSSPSSASSVHAGTVAAGYRPAHDAHVMAQDVTELDASSRVVIGTNGEITFGVFVTTHQYGFEVSYY